MSRDRIEELGDDRPEFQNPFRGVGCEFIATLGFWVVGIAGWVLGAALGDWTGYAFMALGFIIVWRWYVRADGTG